MFSDENSTWWRSQQGLYQAGGAYFNFPENNEDIINSSNTYWMLRKYGTEDEHHGVWKYSEMKSRAEGNRYHLGRVDLLIPGQNVLYTAIRITNTGIRRRVLRFQPKATDPTRHRNTVRHRPFPKNRKPGTRHTAP